MPGKKSAKAKGQRREAALARIAVATGKPFKEAKAAPRRAGPASEVQILLGMSKAQNDLIVKAAKACDETRASFIRDAAHYWAEKILGVGK